LDIFTYDNGSFNCIATAYAATLIYIFPLKKKGY